MRVLVVEDEPLIRMLATDILAGVGHAVSEATSAAAARTMASNLRFDVAVVDLGLPDSSCAALLLALIEAQPGIGIVISTGRQPDDPLVAAACRAAGGRVSAVLGKPWTEHLLLDAVARSVRPGPACDAGVRGALGWRLLTVS